MVSTPLSAPGISGESKERLRLWIRLLRASRTIEAELRERLRQEFDTTLPRFDVMAALYRAPRRHADERPVALPAGVERQRHRHRRPAGLRGAGDARRRRNGDRRTSMVRLTEAGAEQFRAMAVAHERWIGELLGDVGGEETKQLSGMLKGFRSNWEGRE